MKKALTACLLIILILVSGCNSTKEMPQRGLGQEKPVVAATIFPLADLMRHIGGDAIEVITLLPAGASPHTFEPTPREMKAASRARLLVSVGAGLDLWGQKLVQTIGQELREVVVTENLRLLPLMGHPDDQHHHEGQGDPHVWLDPILVKEVIAPELAKALINQWPELAPTFQENLLALQKELGRLDKEFRLASSTFTEHKFISFHATWGYLADRYGLQEVASLLEYPGQEPSARWLAALTEMAREEQVRNIFMEPQFNPRPAEVLAKEIGGQVFALDPLGGEGVAGRDGYLKLLEYNFRILKEAFGS